MNHTTTVPEQVQDPQVDPRFWLLIAILHRGGAYWHFWLKQTSDSCWFFVGVVVSLFVAYILRYDIYFTVNPCGPDTQTRRKHKSANEDVIAVNCLYGDFDAKDFPGGLGAVFDHVTSLPWRPSVAVASGGGIQCYWLAREPWLCSDPDSREAIAVLQHAWVGLVGADPTVHDLARILRVPGTFNRKYTPARPVSFLWCDLGRMYEWCDLLDAAADVLPTIAEQRRQRAVAFEHSGAGGQTTLPSDDDALIRRAIAEFQIGRKLELLMNGDVTAYGSDESAADLALASLLAYLFAKDETRIRRAMCASKLYRDKWERDGYLGRTISLACEKSLRVYTPPDPAKLEAIAATKELAAGAVRGA